MLAANVPMLSVIPASVYGYAVIAAFFLLHTFGIKSPTPGEALLLPSMENPIIAIAVSVIVGSLFGYVSQKIGVAMGPRRRDRQNGVSH